MWLHVILLLLLLCLCHREYKARGLKQEAKNKISTVARGPDLRQNTMTREWAPSCSAVSRLTAAGTGRRSHVDLGMKHSSDDRPHSGSQDPTHSVGRDSRRRSVGKDSLREGQNIWIPSLPKQFKQRHRQSGTWHAGKILSECWLLSRPTSGICRLAKELK